MGTQAQIHLADNAARTLTLGGDLAPVRTAGDDDGETDLVLDQAVAADIQLAFRVEVALDGDVARDAADVAVAVDDAAVYTVGGLAERDLRFVRRDGIVGEDLRVLLLKTGELVYGLYGRA